MLNPSVSMYVNRNITRIYNVMIWVVFAPYRDTANSLEAMIRSTDDPHLQYGDMGSFRPISSHCKFVGGYDP